MTNVANELRVNSKTNKTQIVGNCRFSDRKTFMEDQTYVLARIMF